MNIGDLIKAILVIAAFGGAIFSWLAEHLKFGAGQSAGWKAVVTLVITVVLGAVCGLAGVLLGADQLDKIGQIITFILSIISAWTASQAWHTVVNQRNKRLKGPTPPTAQAG